MAKCPDCGGNLEGGICSNCQEELFMITYQADDFGEVTLSDEFAKKAEEQKEYLKKRKRDNA